MLNKRHNLKLSLCYENHPSEAQEQALPLLDRRSTAPWLVVTDQTPPISNQTTHHLNETRKVPMNAVRALSYEITPTVYHTTAIIRALGYLAFWVTKP